VHHGVPVYPKIPDLYMPNTLIKKEKRRMDLSRQAGNYLQITAESVEKLRT
jgi:hypothetical protein